MKKDKKPVFETSMFDIENVDDNNNNTWKEFERISETGDDRSKTILAGIIVEHYLDRLLKLLFIDYKLLTERPDFTFSFKISMLKSLRLIPNDILLMCDCVRKVRNIFAHNFEIENIEELETKVKNVIIVRYNENVKDKKNIKLIKMFEAIYRIGSGNLRTYEQNIRLLRQEIDNPNFEKKLQKTNNEIVSKKHEEITSGKPIKTIDRGNRIEEKYPNSITVMKNKNNS